MNSDKWKEWLQQNLVCPRDHQNLKIIGNTLVCPLGHIYHLVDEIPVMLIDDILPTQKKEFENTLSTVKRINDVGVTDNFNEVNYFTKNLDQSSSSIDPFVQEVIGATGGNLYENLIDKLSRYPIPDIPLEQSNDKYLLDIGCNWGRWSIAAAKLGYNSIGIDHNLEALRAAKRVCNDLGVVANFIVADGRYLPFRDHTFDVVFSYSVLQHFSKDDVRQCLTQVSRILKQSGFGLIQLPNVFGLVNLMYQLKRGFRSPVGFEVRYWSKSEILDAFSQRIGETNIFVDGFFSLNPQVTDLDLIPWYYRWIVIASNNLKRSSEKVNWVSYIADSFYVKSIKNR
jgi:SAM-dependent methyltransferase